MPATIPTINPAVVTAENLNLPQREGSAEIASAYQNRLLLSNQPYK